MLGQGSWSDMVDQPLRAVIIFIAGFETEGGAPELGAEFIMREDIVVVTLEYRSGVLGFLSDGTKYMPGNLGLEDVRVALGWVQQNIGDFGGDPGKVTVAGHGQGATIAHLLALNPTTSALFSKMILASGSALCEGSLSSPTLSYSSASNSNSRYSSSSSYSSSSTSTRDTTPELPHPYYVYKKVLTATKCSSLRCLQEKPVQELLKAQETIEKEHVSMTTVFTPTIDIDLRPQPLVPRDPRKLEQAGTRIPLLIGATRDEGFAAALAYSSANPSLMTVSKLRETMLPQLLSSILGQNRGYRAELVESVFRQYFADEGQDSRSRDQTQEALGEMLGDLLVHSCIRETVQLHRRAIQPTFSYLFSYVEEEPFMGLRQYQQSGIQYQYSGQYNAPGGQAAGGSHKVERGSELRHIFSPGPNSNQQMGSQRLGQQSLASDQISKNLTFAWASFASTDRPPSVFPIDGLNLQPNQIVRKEWTKVSERGSIATYNISLHRGGIFHDFRKAESVFWTYQMEFLEDLSLKTASLKGYAIATWGLVALLLVAGLIAGAGYLQMHRRKKEDEQAMEGRDYASWVSNMNNLKKSEPGQNSYEVNTK